ncbi:CorA-like Mg2+ transporter domain-containing protein [Cryptosporidium muris RN66]|uniref:Magnesium transporter n=1 Tax=Cryptosporidium muris (strain RN66) TaxID=441375 RepID=B6AEN9_CRYMR|nr:CorA-like Mg2+ transporter domain-containing protein [Cryptosporidium muris RN66]EEA06656.1 CorA-like Mg2+ transporter domain-containing protein [Cryptosporidium muris RN66]|eukprot:XP_002141005.1 CorA-like Mg2+ transporter domain-containing protein [Cryptosporidium muris RN66]
MQSSFSRDNKQAQVPILTDKDVDEIVVEGSMEMFDDRTYDSEESGSQNSNSSDRNNADFLDRVVDQFHGNRRLGGMHSLGNDGEETGPLLYGSNESQNIKMLSNIHKRHQINSSDHVKIGGSREFLEALQAKTRKYITFEIGRGYRRCLLLQTGELLRLVHSYNKECVLQDTVPGALKLRDLRQVVSIGSCQRPSIEVRKNCILVNVPHFRVIILHQKVLLIDSGYLRSPLEYPSSSININNSNNSGIFNRKSNDFMKSQLQTTPSRYPLSGQDIDGTITVNSTVLSPTTDVIGSPNSQHQRQIDMYNDTNYDNSINIPCNNGSSNSYSTFFPNFGIEYTPIDGFADKTITSSGYQYIPPGIEDGFPLLRKLEHLANIPSSTPFECLVLETILVESCNIINRQVRPIRDSVLYILDSFQSRNRETRRLLNAVSELRRRLNAIEELAQGLLKAITEMLGNEEDMQRLEISYYWTRPEDWQYPKNTPYHEEVENVLECYAQEVEMMLQQIASIGESLEDALKVLTLEMSSLRNSIMKADLGLSIIATIVGFCGFFVDCFGMNLRSGLEEVGPALFWFITWGLVALCAAGAIVVLTTFRKIDL